MSQEREDCDPDTPEHGGRFLFVDVSTAKKRPRIAQRAINIHIQQSAQKVRKPVQSRKKGEAANTSRSLQRSPGLLRAIEPRLLSSQTTAPPAQSRTSSQLTSPPGLRCSPPIASSNGRATRDSPNVHRSDPGDRNTWEAARTIQWLDRAHSWHPLPQSAVATPSGGNNSFNFNFGNLTTAMKVALQHCEYEVSPMP